MLLVGRELVGAARRPRRDDDGDDLLARRPRRAASNTLNVPLTSTSMASRGLLGAMRDADGRLVEHEIDAVASPRSARPRSRTSPSTSVTSPRASRGGQVLDAGPRTRLSSTTISPYVPSRCPSTSWSTMCEPISPAPPVTRTFSNVRHHSALSVLADSGHAMASTTAPAARPVSSGIHRQRQHLVGGGLGVREVARAVAELGEACCRCTGIG